MRIKWPREFELAEDDVRNYFTAYGEVETLEWVKENRDTSVKTIRLYFRSAAAVVEATRRSFRGQHFLPAFDGDVVTVDVYVKCSDNATKA